MKHRDTFLLAILIAFAVVASSRETARAQEPFATGDRVILESLGTIAGPRWLDGRTLNGSVGLAPTFDGPYSGATWEIVGLGGNEFGFKTLGEFAGPRWLTCVRENGTVALSSATSTQTRWRVIASAPGTVAIGCADGAAPAWLDGRTQTATVGLAPSTAPPFTGALWRVHGVRPADVLTQRNDAFRTGSNLAETILTPALLRAHRFGKLFTRKVEGQMYAQPLYADNLHVSGARHNVVFVATTANYVYAFDADRAEIAAPLWRSRRLGAPIVWTDIVQDTLIQPLIGIVSTPVIDESTQTLYVVAKSKTVDPIARIGDLHDADTITLQSLGTVPGPTWLDAHTGDGSVHLAPAFGGPAFTGTWWEVHRQNDALALRSLGWAGGNALWLDGRTANKTVGLAPTTAPPFSGTAWKIDDAGGGAVALETQGSIPGPRFLDGHTADATVALAPAFAPPFSGARWRVERHAFHNVLYAIDLPSGAVKRSVEIGGSAAGTTFFPKGQLNRPGLLLADGNIYVAFGAHADHAPWNGWVFAYRAADFAPAGAFVAAPQGNGAGIWQSGTGLTGDGAGNVYAMTGNGGAGPGAADYSNSFVKLRGTGNSLILADAFHAAASQTLPLNACDLDLGSSGPVHLPGTTLLIGAGKQGILYTLDENAMARPRQSFTVAHDRFNPAAPVCVGWNDVLTWPHVHGSPVAWRTGERSFSVYVWPEQDHLEGYLLTDGRFTPAPFATSSDVAPLLSMPGGMLALTADGTQRDTGIVWAMRPRDCPPGATNDENARPCNAQFNTVPGLLKAFDAQTLVELWSSGTAGDALGMLAKFSPPTVTRGKVYAGTFGASCTVAACWSELVVYGVLPGR